jgi:MFS family permease
MYASAAVVGMVYAITIGNIACVCSHLYNPDYVEYVFGFQSAVGGIGGFLGPFTAGLIQPKFGQSAGFWYLAGLILFGGMVLIVASLFRRRIIKPYEDQLLQTAEPSQDNICKSYEGNSNSNLSELDGNDTA